jgi:hypothetical protein
VSVEARTLGCPAGWEGAVAQERTRTRTTATTTYPWGEADLVSVEYSAWTNWSETANTCTRIPDDRGGDGPDGGGSDTGGPDEAAPDTGRDRGSNMGPDAICGCDPDGGDGGDGGS